MSGPGRYPWSCVKWIQVAFLLVSATSPCGVVALAPYVLAAAAAAAAAAAVPPAKHANISH